MKDFLLICRPCFQANHEDWEYFGRCNIHHNIDGTLVLTCFNCGNEEMFAPTQTQKTTAEQSKMYHERARIQAELQAIESSKERMVN